MEISKELKGKSGIYLLKINGKIYIGSSVDMYRRLKQHFNHLNKGCHRNKHLQSSWDKYKSIQYSVVEECSVDTLAEREDYYIEYYNSFNLGFNQSYSSKSPLGYKHTDEAKRVMSLKKKGVKQPKEVVEKRVKSLIGKKRSEEFKRKMSERMMGKNNPMYGKKESEEHKKLRMKNMLSTERWNKGLTKDNNEIIRRMSENRKGKPAHNRIPHKLILVEDGTAICASSLTQLSELSGLSKSSLVRLKNNTASKNLKNKYKLEW